MKCSNDAPKLNIHKYTNYNMIEIYVNRLSTTRQIFVAMDYSIMMSEKYFHFRKRQVFGKEIFCTPRRSNWIHELWNFFSNYVFLRFFKDTYKNLKESGITQAVSKLTIFVNLWISKLHKSALIKKLKQWNLEHSFCCEKLSFSVKHHIFEERDKILGFVNYRL